MSKTKVISFMNMKGGVGKTTLCLNMAYHLSKFKEKKILIIDLDPQFNLTNIYFMMMKDCITLKTGCNKSNKINVLMHGLREKQQSILEIYSNSDRNIKKIILNDRFDNDEVEFLNKKNKNLSIIPSHIDLIEREMIEHEGQVSAIKNFIENLKKIGENYEYVFIDCPPTYSLFFRSSYEASDYVIIPVNDKPLSSLGFRLFDRAADYCVGITNSSNDTEKKEKRVSKCKILGIVYTSVQHNCKNRPHDSHYEGNYIFNSFIKELRKISKNDEFMSCIVEKNIRTMINNVCEEFLERLEELERIEAINHGK